MEHKQNYDQKVRGYRNNNPLNLRISRNAWKGKLPKEQNTDGSFEQFETMALGFRAALMNLRTHIRKGRRTVRDLITVWAPESDGNNTQRYIERVCRTTGMEPQTMIVPADREQMVKLVYAMAIVENGSRPEWDDVYAGYDML